MNKEIFTILENLEGCIGMFDYLLTPVESNLLVSYIKGLEHNWNELKKWLEDYYDYGDCLKIKFILNKMQSLEEGGNNE